MCMTVDIRDIFWLKKSGKVKTPTPWLCMATVMPTTPLRFLAHHRGWMKPSAGTSPSLINVTNPQTQEVCKEKEIK